MARQKSLFEAYILGIPFGIFGAHHFYLGRYRYGILYLCTLGLFGIGYLVDLFRMKWLVDHTNKHGNARKELSDVYLLGALGGIFGAHHFYMNNKRLGLLYLCTVGVFGIGWIADLFRMRWLVRDHNNQVTDNSLSTAYIIGASPLGLFGGHHYYLKNYGLGITYTCTLGVFGIGWVVDLIRMKLLVKDSNFSDKTVGKSLITSYIFGASPLGLFGAHHYYLGNYGVGVAYTCTLGVFCIGWVIDLFRMRWLVEDSGGNKSTKSVGTAYILGLSPLGLFGASHYYIGNYVIGVLYTCTVGVFGIGWFVDLFQMGTLVDIANKKGSWHTLATTYILATPPLGIFGGHHYYLGRIKFGIFYSLTLGLFGIGWLVDLYRMPVLFKRFTKDDKHKYVDDVFMLWFPFGLFGLHHFYLERKKWGIIYACTFGCLGIGWFIDAFRLVSLVNDYNEDNNVIGTLIPLTLKCYCSPKNCRKCFRRSCTCPCDFAKLCSTLTPCWKISSMYDGRDNDGGIESNSQERYQMQNKTNLQQYDDDPENEIPYEVRMMHKADANAAVNGDAGCYGDQSYHQEQEYPAANPEEVNVDVNQATSGYNSENQDEADNRDLGEYDYNDYHDQDEHPALPEPPSAPYYDEQYQQNADDNYYQDETQEEVTPQKHNDTNKPN